MRLRKKVTAEQFVCAFRKQWDNDVEEGNMNYPDLNGRTNFMLNDEDSLLRRISRKLDLDVAVEFQTLDCVYYKEESRQIEYGNYPACLEVIIEHENDGDVRQEMWKLLSFRSPLKVLIFYDWDEDKKTTDSRRKWLRDQIEAFFRMGCAFDNRWPEAEDTEYLFLVGNRDKDEIIRWRYLTARSGEFQRLGKLPALEYLRSVQ